MLTVPNKFYTDMLSGDTFTVGDECNNHKLVSINIQESGSLRSLQFRKMNKDGSLSKKNKPVFVFAWDMDKIDSILSGEKC